MKTLRILHVLTNIFISLFTYSQAKETGFKFQFPEIRSANSFYKSILLLDIRTDTSNLGIVQKGGFNRKEKVVPEIPLSGQFNDLVNHLADSTSKSGELLLLLREFNFAEITGAMSEKGYFHFRAILYAKAVNDYLQLQTLDTVVLVRAMDVTKKMFREASKAVTEFIAGNLSKQPVRGMVLTQELLPKIDSIEKSKLPLYSQTTLTEGIYKSFQSFVNQQPDETGVSVSFYKDGKVKTISFTNGKDRRQEIESRFTYAFVYEGKAYVSGDFSCYPLEKRDNDFYFIGKGKDAKGGDVAAASFFFGIIGGLIASSANSVFEMKIDHLSGGFVRIKEIEK